MSACSTSPATAPIRTRPRRTPPTALAPPEYGAWLLGNFASVDEVKANFDKVVLVPMILPQLNQAPPVHYVVHDKTGKSIVIEPVDKTLKIYDNPLGVLTNSPTFDWHMTNLRNYVNLSVTNVPPDRDRRPEDPIVRPGLGHARAARRFHAAVALRPRRGLLASRRSPRTRPTRRPCRRSTSSTISTSRYGSVRDKDGNVIHAEYTLWTAASDLKNLKWYFKTFDDQSIHSVDLKAAMAAAKGGIQRSRWTRQQPIIDVSTRIMGAN